MQAFGFLAALVPEAQHERAERHDDHRDLIERDRDDEDAEDRRHTEFERERRIEPPQGHKGTSRRARSSRTESPLRPGDEQKHPIVVGGIEPVHGAQPHLGDEPPPAPPAARLHEDQGVVAEPGRVREVDDLLKIPDRELSGRVFALVSASPHGSVVVENTDRPGVAVGQ